MQDVPDPDLLGDMIRQIAFQLGDWPTRNDGVFFHNPHTKLADPYLREDYILKLCAGKKVLHFGFADSPFTKDKIKSGDLLHQRIKGVASEVWGSDINSEAISIYTKETGDTNTWAMDVCAPLKEIDKYKKDFDVIVFGEIIEHLMNPGDALKNLHKLCIINNASLVVTTANAFNCAGFVAALIGNEIVHPEHYYYFSPVTLSRLICDSGFSKVDISFYAGKNTSDSPGLTYPGLIAECTN